MRIWPGLAMSNCILIAALQLYGQSDQASKSFEVASIRLLPEPSRGVNTGSDPGRWWRTNVTMASLLVEAFHIQGHAIAGPDWLRAARYEISAKLPAGVNREDVPLMVQRLITERFGLRFHREQREMPGYALVTGRNGPKLKSSSGSPAPIPGREGFGDLPEGVGPGGIQVDS